MTRILPASEVKSHFYKLIDGVAIGDEVNQGQQIGDMGATGEVTGATGCHVHFEVDGARNPFVKR